MIFTNTIRSTHKVELILKALNFAVIGLHGKMPQDKRLAALNKFKSGKSTILVATDVASRGLDIPEVNLVLNYDVPQKSKDYIHRVGRTARAGRSGLSIAVVTQCYYIFILLYVFDCNMYIVLLCQMVKYLFFYYVIVLSKRRC